MLEIPLCVFLKCSIAHLPAALLIGISQQNTAPTLVVIMHERVESAHLIQQPRQADTRHLRLEGLKKQSFVDEISNGNRYTVAFF